MKFYETTYIIHSALQAGRLDDLTKTIEDKVKKAGGKIVFSDSWGRKKLAHMIDKQKYGTYMFFQFTLDDNSNLSDLNQAFELNVNVLRHLIVKIEENQMMETREVQEKSEPQNNSKDMEKTTTPEDEKATEETAKEEAAPGDEKATEETTGEEATTEEENKSEDK